MAASFVAAFLPFPLVHLGTSLYIQDLVPTSGLKTSGSSILPSVISRLSGRAWNLANVGIPVQYQAHPA
ncbi:hypothetical protein B0H14DRAFT_3540846 [Mycena olivaceomarginata]|nr:hypothetical protein B0H14DRAFT_3540846 [Mycena olivaceomarginata]